ncbi:MAG: gamma-glutamyl-gamma-aminobutyrate hydrolase family protein, partial [Actinobacteria bacterium]|nr:gamma-glutamyl-gamma-aminobutyrate hydrolase family protein [Actinomycetota bacterium]
MTRILVVDNYDSFVYTIVGYLRQLGAEVDVVRNDAVPPLAERTGYDGVLISPGPGNPSQAGASLQVIRDCAAAGTPMLGVCLGHQALGEVFGGTVTHAPELMHGKTSLIEHDGTGVLAGLPVP